MLLARDNGPCVDLSSISQPQRLTAFVTAHAPTMHHLQGQELRWAPLFKGILEETAAFLTKENVILFFSVLPTVKQKRRVIKNNKSV